MAPHTEFLIGPRGSLSLVVRSIFRKTIASFIRHFEHFHARPGAFINTRRVAQEVYETTQMHSAMARELIDLAASALDSRPIGRNIHIGNDVFAADHYYLHGIAFCEVRRKEGSRYEEEPADLQLFVSFPPPEYMVHRLLKRRNSVVLSSASVKQFSPLTNLNVDWIKSKHLGELADDARPDKRLVIDLDEPAAGLLKSKMDTVDALIEARHWYECLPDVRIFPAQNDDDTDQEFHNGTEELVKMLDELNRKGIPVLCIVATNSYKNARKILRRLTDMQEHLRIGELIGINTDKNRQGLSIMERWVMDDRPVRGANGAPSTAEDSMLFDEIEYGVARRMGKLLGYDEVRNGVVVGVYKKMMRGANFRASLEGIRLGRAGKKYVHRDFRVDPDNPYVDFNGIVFAEHPRNFVSRENYRRIAIQAISIGDRALQESLTSKLRAGNFQVIQSAIKWSRLGAKAVLDVTTQGAGRNTRTRSVLPAHRFILLSDKHARLFMLGMGDCQPGEILITPDLRALSDACTQYWADMTLSCDDESAGAARWVSEIYKKPTPPTLAELETVRDIREFLSDPTNHILSSSKFDEILDRVFKHSHPTGPTARSLRTEAIKRLRCSYMDANQVDRTNARIRHRTFILRHDDGMRLSLLSYRWVPRSFGNAKENLFMLKPRELYELAYPAADERAIATALDNIKRSIGLDYSVKSSIEHDTFMGAVLDGSHEAGDFHVILDGFHLLLDCKTTAVASKFSPWNRSPEDRAREVSGKIARFKSTCGSKVDAFVFVCSGWPYQDVWYTDPETEADCGVPVYWMDACTTFEDARMAKELRITLIDITNSIKKSRSGPPDVDDTASDLD